MDSSRRWKMPAAIALLALLGILSAVYGTAIARRPARPDPAPVRAVEPPQDAVGPSNEIREFQQQG